MSYSKLQKVIQDYALGYQTTNQASTNEQSFFDAYDAEHFIDPSSGGVLTGFGPASRNGEHDHITIPRACGSVIVSSVPVFGGTTQYFVSLELASQHFLFPIQRIDAGDYWMPISGLTGPTIWCEAHPIAAAVSTYRIIRSRYHATFAGLTAGSTSAGIRFLLFERNSGSGEFELADYDFSIALIGAR